MTNSINKYPAFENYLHETATVMATICSELSDHDYGTGLRAYTECDYLEHKHQAPDSGIIKIIDKNAKVLSGHLISVMNIFCDGLKILYEKKPKNYRLSKESVSNIYTLGANAHTISLSALGNLPDVSLAITYSLILNNLSKKNLHSTYHERNEPVDAFSQADLNSLPNPNFDYIKFLKQEDNSLIHFDEYVKITKDIKYRHLIIYNILTQTLETLFYGFLRINEVTNIHNNECINVKELLEIGKKLQIAN